VFGRRFAVAVIVALAVILSAPFAQQLFTEVGNRWPQQFRAIGIAATAVPLAAALLVALVRIRERRAARYTALALSLAVTGSYILLTGLSFGESFHFVEYGLVAFFFYRAWRPLRDGSMFLLPLLAGVIVGSVDEWFQWFIPIRAGEARDVALNTIAIGCGVLFALAVDPPPRPTLALRRESFRRVGLGAIAALVVFGLFFQTVHVGYEIGDGEGHSFRSRFSAADLEAAGYERAARWRAQPPVTQRRVSREDQYLSEGLWHVRRRNRDWSEGDARGAWHENRILEQFFAPVLDTPTYASASGHRWPPEQRADAAARAAADLTPYESAAHPFPIHVWPTRWLVAVGVGRTEAPPHLIVHNALIHTMDARYPRAQAIAVRGGRIVRVGGSADVLALKGPATRVIDARQATIVPGLHDAHAHFTSLGASLQNLDLRGTTSYEQIVDMVRQRAAGARAGEWIVGRGWDQNDWPRQDWPAHTALSAVSPDNPVYLTRIDGHAALVNRRALEAGGVTRATRDPAGGRIVRERSGEPGGVLIDGAMDLVASRIPPVGAAQLDEQILLADRETRKLGLTTIHDAGTDGPTVDVYKRLIDAGKLKTRLYVMLRGPIPALAPFLQTGPLANYSDRRLAVRAIKITADGALGSRGAALLQPYADDPRNTGLLTTPPEEIYQRTLAASKAGFQTCIHAIGDRANRLVMDVFERVQRELPASRNLRMRNEHAQVLDGAEIPRFAALGIIASMQPAHATSDMPWVPARIGAARMEEGAYVWQSLLEAGATIAAGSDFPVEVPDPLRGFHAAITRQDPLGQPAGGWTPRQRMSREQALRSFTLDAAYAAHAEAFTGSLEAGKLADFVILSKDIMSVPPKEILATFVQMTIVAGEVVYERRAGIN
jgi:predicted amidohydrolase YtcJ